MSKEQIAAEGGHDHDGHDHSPAGSQWSLLTTFFAATSAMLLLALILALVIGRKHTPA
jgi:hypothetical protein